MTTVTVERELLEHVEASLSDYHAGAEWGKFDLEALQGLRALLSEQPQAGAGQLPVEWRCRIAGSDQYAHFPTKRCRFCEPLYTAQPPHVDEARRLREALEFACKSLAIVTSSDGSGHADIALIAMRMAGLHPDESEPLVAGWKAKAQWRADAALTQSPKGEEE